MGRQGASVAEVRNAARQARVDEFAEALPGGYDYMLGEGGSGLSGGQRQRVSIARAFLKNAPVLILDEATSALDMKSEAAIQSELENLAQGHTTFVIAHRFSTIRMAQRILVFEAGIPSLLRAALNRSRSSAAAIDAAELPKILTPALSRSSARLIAV